MESAHQEIYVGHRHGWEHDSPFGISLEERLQHLYLIGQSGTGKTTLLRNLILSDIYQGRGVALVDPHGDLSTEILDHIPQFRMDDVVYFDPTCRRPISINLLRAGNNWHLAASGIVSTFKKIWKDSWGPRLEYVLYATVAALIQANNTSLLGISRMLYDDRYREWVVRQIKDPMILSFWINEFELYDRRFLQEVISPIQNKVGQLFFVPPIRHVLGQVGTQVDFRFMMDTRKIFIANISKGKLGEMHSNLLGSLLVTAFEIAALSRADLAPELRTDFFLYVDEFQNCATDSFASILSEARKYRLCLTLAHQYVGQLEEEISNAIFGNVGSYLTFRVGESDAAVLERQFGGEYARAQFTGLNNYELFVKLLNGQPFRATSLPPFATGQNLGRTIRIRSRQKYGTKRERIEERIDRWLKRRH
jgi:hypothetical protein